MKKAPAFLAATLLSTAVSAEAFAMQEKVTACEAVDAGNIKQITECARAQLEEKNIPFGFVAITVFHPETEEMYNLTLKRTPIKEEKCGEIVSSSSYKPKNPDKTSLSVTFPKKDGMSTTANVSDGFMQVALYWNGVDKYERRTGEVFITTPVNDKIISEKTVRDGFNFLQSHLKKALSALENVPSHAHKGKSVAQVIRERGLENLLINLAINEHMDESVFKTCGKRKSPKEIQDAIRKESGRILTFYNLNGEESYEANKSPKGAGGPMQIMPKTMSGLSELYDVPLNSSQLTSAMKAAALHLDDELRQFIQRGIRRPTYAQFAIGYNMSLPNFFRYGELSNETQGYTIKTNGVSKFFAEKGLSYHYEKAEQVEGKQKKKKGKK